MQSGKFFYIRRVDFGMTDGRIWGEAADPDGYDEIAYGLIVLSIDSSKKVFSLTVFHLVYTYYQDLKDNI